MAAINIQAPSPQVTPQEQIAQKALDDKITELNMRLKAQENYKKYGLLLGVIAVGLRLFSTLFKGNK